MDGIHDLGGTQGFGKVSHKLNSLSYKPVFHEEWEHLAYGLLFLGAGHMELFSVDEIRHAVERIDTRSYFGSSYYDRIVIGTATLFVEYGVITQEELDTLLGSEFLLALPVKSEGRSGPVGSDQFEIGDQVTVRDEFISGHIRVPAYVRGKSGVILHRTTEKWPFPDAIGHGDRTAELQSTYHVQFSAKDIWGSSADEGFVVVDLFQGYLDIANADQDMPTVTELKARITEGAEA